MPVFSVASTGNDDGQLDVAKQKCDKQHERKSTCIYIYIYIYMYFLHYAGIDPKQ